MIIYEFSTWLTRNNEMYTIKEIDVEEKAKIYTARGVRINKADIDKLQKWYGNKMYRLDNNAEPYITAMIDRKRCKMEKATEDLKQAIADFNKWFDLKESEVEE